MEKNPSKPAPVRKPLVDEVEQNPQQRAQSEPPDTPIQQQTARAYRVLSPLKHDGKIFVIGASVSLSDEDAAALHGLGAIEAEKATD